MTWANYVVCKEEEIDKWLDVGMEGDNSVT
jgi:hypothetical protein